MSFLQSFLLSVQLEAYMEILSLDYCTRGVSGLFGHEFCYCLVLGCGGNRPSHLHLCVHWFSPGRYFFPCFMKLIPDCFLLLVFVRSMSPINCFHSAFLIRYIICDHYNNVLANDGVTKVAGGGQLGNWFRRSLSPNSGERHSIGWRWGTLHCELASTAPLSLKTTFIMDCWWPCGSWVSVLCVTAEKGIK